MHWNSWVFQRPLRFVVGIPLALLGGMLAVCGVVTDDAGQDRTLSPFDAKRRQAGKTGSIRVSQRYFGAFRGFSWVI